MEDYRTRRLESGSDEPEPQGEEPEEEIPAWAAPPPLPAEPEETPPPVPEVDEPAPASGPTVFYQAPAEPQSFEGVTVISPSSWAAPEPEVPSPFDEAEITPEPVTPSRGGGVQAAPSPGPGAPEKKNKTLLIVGIVAAVLLLLCCCCAIVFFIYGLSTGEWDTMRLGATLVAMLL